LEVMSFEDFISRFNNLTINKKNDSDPTTHDSNHINFAAQIGNLLQNNNTPFYAKISERWALINDKNNFIHNWQEPKEDKELYHEIFQWATDGKKIDILDLFDTALCFKKDLNGSFYDRYVTMNIPNLKIHREETIYALQKILQATQTILLIFGPYGRECLLYVKKHEQYSRLIPTFKEILEFTIEAKRYFSIYVLHYFFIKDVNFEEGEINDYIRFIFYKKRPLNYISNTYFG
ncbi:12219_t:CDS:2, partial [Cetraspora pellucida]